MKISSKEILETMLEKTGVEAQVSERTEGEAIILTIDSPDTAMIIGHHGETLLALQTLVRNIYFRSTQTWTPVVVDCGNYREERVGKVRELAKASAEKSRFLSTTVALPPMNASDRREVHLMVMEINGVLSESAGEGRDRHVVIRPESISGEEESNDCHSEPSAESVDEEESSARSFACDFVAKRQVGKPQAIGSLGTESPGRTSEAQVFDSEVTQTRRARRDDNEQVSDDTKKDESTVEEES